MRQNGSTRVLLRRLASMGADEIRGRLLQELSKYEDLWRCHLGLEFVGRGQNIEPVVKPRFFFRSQDIPQIVRWIRERLPETAGGIVERAERIRAHRFDLLGYKDLHYGPEIDWDLDIVHGKRAPHRPWFKMRYLDFQEVGDSKVIWELNRHQHLVTLAKAYHLSGKKQFIEELFKQWFHWQEHNPYPIGINWASSLEVAFRSLSWLWVWHLLQECPLVPDGFVLDLRRALSVSARHIERYLSTYFSPNTHLLGEAVALFFIGTMFPELPNAGRWQSRGWQLTLEQAEKQVRPDGMHFEQSLYYHTYAIDFFLHASILAGLNGIGGKGRLEPALGKMLEVLCRLSQNGVVPQFGDDDGGRLFDPQRNRAEHVLDPLATGAVLLHRADFKFAAGGLREETIWLLGIDGARKFEALEAQQQKQTSFALESSGIYVSVASDPISYQLTIDAGPQGAGRAGHGHADALSVQVSINGQTALVDPGTLSYVDEQGDRDQFRGTSAHNTLRVDGCDQAEPAGPFGWQYLPKVEVERWLTGRSFDFFVGSHSGYGRLANPVQHRRFLVHLKSRFWLIRDVVRGEGVHRLDLNWQIAAHLLISDSGNNLLLKDRDQAVLTLVPVSGRRWQQKTIPQWFSPIYGVKQCSSAVQFTTTGVLPKEFATVFIPKVNARSEGGVLTALHAETGDELVSAYAYSESGYSSYFVFAEQAGSWKKGKWASDASFVLCEEDSAGNLLHLVVCDGSHVDINGQQRFASRKPVARYEWFATPDGRVSYCSDPTTVVCVPETGGASSAGNLVEASISEAHNS